MIKTAAWMFMNRLEIRHERSDFCGERGCIRRWVSHGEVPAPEAAEVIHQPSSDCRRGQCERGGFPMGTYDQDGSWLRDRSRPAEQLVHPLRIVEDRRSSVA